MWTYGKHILVFHPPSTLSGGINTHSSISLIIVLSKENRGECLLTLINMAEHDPLPTRNFSMKFLKTNLLREVLKVKKYHK